MRWKSHPDCSVIEKRKEKMIEQREAVKMWVDKFKAKKLVVSGNTECNAHLYHTPIPLKN